ncbi:MAG: DUF2163 domain-containing protein [Rhodobacteraceae bacterium]|nr:DUF2163 domain-containing protein [Paracoccaceae bacterium]
MTGFDAGLKAHLERGLTTVARAWAVERSDGEVFGFTDHDGDLVFDGITFRAGTGLTAAALQQTTGLSVDNTEALGALSDGAITEADILSGRFDEACVRAWLVNWADVSERQLTFQGTFGEVVRVDGAFRVELRGLSERLNRPIGRVFQKPCTAVLGDSKCGFDLGTPGYVYEGAVMSQEASRIFDFGSVSGFEPGWFQRGRLTVLSGVAKGLSGAIKRDVLGETGARRIELWEPLRAPIADGDILKVVAGCDKRFASCRLKFNNTLNFQGFPDLPSEDWLMVHPTASASTNGGSRR